MNLEDLYRLLRSGHVQAQGIVDTMDAPLIVLDSSLIVISATAATPTLRWPASATGWPIG